MLSVASTMKKISDKTRRDVAFLWSKINSDEFDQETLTSLLIAVREYADEGSLTRDVGDFVAHSIRDRGIVLQHLRALKIRKVGKTLQFNIPISLDGNAFPLNLGQILKKLGSDEPHKIDETIEQRKDELLLCYLAILHQARLAINGHFDIVLKSTCLLSVMRGRHEKLSIIGVFPDGSKLTIISTPLRGRDWCVMDIAEVEDSPCLRARRLEGKLKLFSVTTETQERSR